MEAKSVRRKSIIVSCFSVTVSYDVTFSWFLHRHHHSSVINENICPGRGKSFIENEDERRHSDDNRPSNVEKGRGSQEKKKKDGKVKKMKTKTTPDYSKKSNDASVNQYRNDDLDRGTTDGTVGKDRCPCAIEW